MKPLAWVTAAHASQPGALCAGSQASLETAPAHARGAAQYMGDVVAGSDHLLAKRAMLCIEELLSQLGGCGESVPQRINARASMTSKAEG
eukprot:4882539-Prymnesium_polylepis.2